jgi:putative transposase
VQIFQLSVSLLDPTPVRLDFISMSVRHVLKSYFEYYERTCTRLALDKDDPILRRVQPPELGKVLELPQVGGLHHRYERRAA